MGHIVKRCFMFLVSFTRALSQPTLCASRILEPEVGLKPTTCALQVRCSINWAILAYKYNWLFFPLHLTTAHLTSLHILTEERGPNSLIDVSSRFVAPTIFNIMHLILLPFYFGAGLLIHRIWFLIRVSQGYRHIKLAVHQTPFNYFFIGIFTWYTDSLNRSHSIFSTDFVAPTLFLTGPVIISDNVTLELLLHLVDEIGGSCRTRTYNHSVNSRGLYHWANDPYGGDDGSRTRVQNY